MNDHRDLHVVPDERPWPGDADYRLPDDLPPFPAPDLADRFAAEGRTFLQTLEQRHRERRQAEADASAAWWRGAVA